MSKTTRVYFGVLQEKHNKFKDLDRICSNIMPHLGSKDAFPSDTMKNPKDCMAVTLRNGRELEKRRNEKKETKEEKQAKIGEELK